VVGGDYFLVTLYELSSTGEEVNHEIVKVTSRVADTLTVTRAFDNTEARAFPSAIGVNPSQITYVSLRWTAYAATNVLSKDGNLEDLESASTARTNLGLGTAATTDASAYATAAQGILADSALQADDIGVTVQGFDDNTVKKNVENTFTDAQRGAITTDNDLSFDLNSANNFLCTPAATGTLTFTNLVSGQSGYIILKNTGGFAISKNALVLAPSTFLTTISTAGYYLLAYHCDGTNVFITSSGVLA
jgi:hypothetical protein